MGGSEVDAISLVPGSAASGLDGVAGELDDEVPVGNVSAASKAVYHEGGAPDEESEVGKVRDSGSGSSAGVVDGSAAKIDSPGSVRSGAGARSGNRSETDSG
jgi:hypothetical protein